MATAMKSSPIFYCLLPLLLAITSEAWADEVFLNNGDRLTGTIIKMEEDTLTLNTPHSGDIKIGLQEVQSFTTDEPVTIEFQDMSREEGRLELLESGEARIVDPKTGSVKIVPLDTVQAVNPPPDIRYKGDTSLGGNSTSGNTDTAAINFSTVWRIWSKKHRGSVLFKYNYGEVNQRVTVRNSRGRLRYEYFLSRVFLNVDQLFEQDTFQDLVLRSSTSAGVGYLVLDRKWHHLDGSVGLGYVYQDFKTEPTAQDPTFTWALNWEWWPVEEKLKLFHRQQGFQDFGSDSTAFRWNADQGINVPLYKGLYFNFEFDYRFNSEPAPGRQETDEAFIFSLGWQVGN